MTKPVIGNVGKNISNDLAHVHYHNERLLAEAMDDLIDGDNDTTRAQQILNELRSINVEEFAIHEKIMRGAFTDAETAAMKLAAQNKGGNP